MLPTAQDARTGLVVGSSATVLSDTVDPLKLSLAGRWLLTLKCTHATRGISLVRYRRRVTPDAPWGPWVTATGVAPAAGETAEIGVDGDCTEDLDLELTGDGGASSVEAYVVGV